MLEREKTTEKETRRTKKRATTIPLLCFVGRLCQRPSSQNLAATQRDNGNDPLKGSVGAAALATRVLGRKQQKRLMRLRSSCPTLVQDAGNVAQEHYDHRFARKQLILLGSSNSSKVRILPVCGSTASEDTTIDIASGE